MLGGGVDLAVSLAFRSSVLANRTLETIRNGDRWTICLWYLCNCKLTSEEGQGQVGRGSKSHVIIEGEGLKNVLIRFTWFVHFPLCLFTRQILRIMYFHIWFNCADPQPAALGVASAIGWSPFRPQMLFPEKYLFLHTLLPHWLSGFPELLKKKYSFSKLFRRW